MKLLWTLLVSLIQATVAAAAPSHSTVAFLLRRSPDAVPVAPTSALAISGPVARLALLQWSVADARPLRLGELPPELVTDDALRLLGRLAQALPQAIVPLASTPSAARPPRLLVLLDGVLPQHSPALAAAFAVGEAVFSVPGGAAALDTARFVRDDLLPYGVVSEERCLLVHGECADSASSLIQLNAQEDGGLSTVLQMIPELRRLAATGERDSLVVAIADPLAAGASYSWTDAGGLARRHVAGVAVPPTRRSAASVKDCYNTQEACQLETANCSSRGDCRNRYARGENDDASGSKACFACHCKVGPNAAHYGGAVCELVDVSSPFWLLVGSGLALVFVLVSAIRLLAAVGEEKLPGILGAGVSRPKG